MTLSESSDSLTPQEVSSPSTEPTEEGPLSAEDLSVLPRRGGASRLGAGVVVAALALAGGYLALQRRAPTEPEASGSPVADPTPAVTTVPAVLPPPPPRDVPEESDEPPPAEMAAPAAAQPQPTKPTAAAKAANQGPARAPSARKAPEPEPEIFELPERRQGPAVARFPDLPTKTLTRLADDDR